MVIEVDMPVGSTLHATVGTVQPAYRADQVTRAAERSLQNAARTVSTVGGSLRDVQMLASYSMLSTTQRYIEADAEAQKRVVELV